ncbi:serine protease, S1-C subfamily, contains C-terminal PDZ domain [Blastococcus aggregatus]|uniref:Serine protease, S1-C subfamily, contains C-terminal PDZ domain n=1 Tax=Blastococcus aggregatus TaxID=38502 RepID=A0A285VHQ6_9ACTN|nr:trypsin-like peptidase domain-containing protein [Blastococcus aggregatus]SOC53644.1 serine protease, S1-C subfamily, contains C-terminal PDZ domain [Blastococcus aggregatus]
MVLQDAYQRVITDVLPSVVEIRSSSGLGSGVVYDDQGHIVTNAHVVGADKDFDVLTSGSATPRSATLVGTFQPNDIAVIKVDDAEGLVPATFADSSDVHVGDIVLAMGNPLGLSATVTDGIVSALGREVSEPVTDFSPPATLPNTIQTSAAINPGNSGGALVNLDGHVIGIPTLAATNPEAGGVAPGIGFAIPSNTVKRLADQLVATGTVTDSGRAALGVGVTTVVDNAGQPQGVGVISVKASGPADQAGIQPGDIIVSVKGTSTPSVQVLGAVLADLQVGETVPVTVRRAGDQEQLEVTLGEL